MSALGLGPWDGMLRYAADFNFDRARRMSRWPVCEVLHAYMDKVRQQAAADYRFRVRNWVSLGPRSKAKAPQPPAILTE